jgi:arsenite methyltransferase
MQYFLNPSFDIDDPAVASALDELHIWSAPFGMTLLDTVEYRPHLNVLDIGSGTGFPLLVLAARLGATCNVYGIDPWEAAVTRAARKMYTLRIGNTLPVMGRGEELPFEDGCFDLIVSNNGINNLDDAEAVLSECRRTSRSGAQLVITVNLPGTMIEFYKIYKSTLYELGKREEIEKMIEHIAAHRKPLKTTKQMIEAAGFHIDLIREETFRMSYTDGEALLNNPQIQIAFLNPWQRILDEEDLEPVFDLLRRRLNEHALRRGQLDLTIPYVCLNCRRK